MKLRTAAYFGFVLMLAAGRAYAQDAGDDAADALDSAADTTGPNDAPADLGVDAVFTDGSGDVPSGVGGAGGAAGVGGATGAGGVTGAGGAIGTGGVTGTGGASGAGGTSAQGGASGQGGADAGTALADASTNEGGAKDGPKEGGAIDVAAGPDVGPLLRDDPGCSVGGGGVPGTEGRLSSIAAGVLIVALSRRRRSRSTRKGTARVTRS